MRNFREILDDVYDEAIVEIFEAIADELGGNVCSFDTDKTMNSYTFMGNIHLINVTPNNESISVTFTDSEGKTNDVDLHDFCFEDIFTIGEFIEDCGKY